MACGKIPCGHLFSASRDGLPHEEGIVMRWLLLIVLSLSVFTGCMHPVTAWNQAEQFSRDIKLLDNYQLQRQSTWVLPASISIYIAMPATSADNRPLAEALNHNIYTAFAAYFPNLIQSVQPLSYSDALKAAGKNDSVYMVYPRVLAWENGVGGWQDFKEKQTINQPGQGDTQLGVVVGDTLSAVSAIGRDVVEVQLTLVEVKSSRIVDVAYIRSKSGYFTYWGEAPADLLLKPLTAYARSFAPF